MSENLPARVNGGQSHELSLIDPEALTNSLKLAEVLAKSRLVPAHFQGSPADCLRAVDLAVRMRQSPFAIMDKMYLVSGKIAFEGQLCAALLNASPELETRLDYHYTGKKREELECVVSAKLSGESKPRTVRVTWTEGKRMAKGARDKWDSQPEQQLAYYGARVWGRRHAPHVLLGMYTPEEIEGTEPQTVEIEVAEEPAIEVEEVERHQDDTRIPSQEPQSVPWEPEPDQEPEYHDPEQPPARGPENGAGGGNGQGGNGAGSSSTISEKKASRAWAIAYKRAETLGYDQKEAYGIMADVLQAHGIPPTSDGKYLPNLIPWRGDTYDRIIADIEAWAPAGTEKAPF